MKILTALRRWAKQLKRDGVMLWFACKHPQTPWYAKALGIFVVAYALSLIDQLPDFVPVLGYVDKVLLLPSLIWLAIRLVPATVLPDCRQQGAEWMAWERAKPRNMRGIALVLRVWIGVAWGAWHWWSVS